MPPVDTLSDVIPGGVNAISSNLTNFGFPISNPAPSIPSNLVMKNPQTSSNLNFIDSLESYVGNGVKSVERGTQNLVNAAGSTISTTFVGIENFGSELGTDLQLGVKSAYSGVKNVVGDAVGGVTGIGQGIFNNMLIWLIVGGGLLYLIVRTGNIKANVSVPL